MYQIITLYTLNFHNVTCQLDLNKSCKKKFKALTPNGNILSCGLHLNLNKGGISLWEFIFLPTFHVSKLNLSNNDSKSVKFMKCFHGHDLIWFQTILLQLLLPPLSRWENWGSESLKDLLQDLRPASATIANRTQAVGPAAQCSFHSKEHFSPDAGNPPIILQPSSCKVSAWTSPVMGNSLLPGAGPTLPLSGG